jgi:predicted RNA-binding protein associated with RNAse of E/G family
MARRHVTSIRIAEQTEADRDGVDCPIDRIVVGNGRLYYARQLAGHRDIRWRERWLLPEQGWVLNRFHLHATAVPTGFDWYIDIDHVQPEGDTWRIDDRFLDLVVIEGSGYELRDADELADGIKAKAISEHETVATLRSLHALVTALRRLQFSGAALLAEYAPELPQ